MKQITIRLTISCEGKKTISISKKKEMNENEVEQLYADTLNLRKDLKVKKVKNVSNQN